MDTIRIPSRKGLRLEKSSEQTISGRYHIIILYPPHSLCD